MVVVGKLAWLAHSSGSANNRAMLYSVDVSHDGSRLVTGGLDSKARVWSVSKIMEALHSEVERQKKVVEDEKSQVTTFFFCVLIDAVQDNSSVPDGALLSVASHGGAVNIARWRPKSQPLEFASGWVIFPEHL